MTTMTISSPQASQGPKNRAGANVAVNVAINVAINVATQAATRADKKAETKPDTRAHTRAATRAGMLANKPAVPRAFGRVLPAILLLAASSSVQAADQANANANANAAIVARSIATPWRHSVPVVVVVGSDAPSGVAGALLPSPVILQVRDQTRLPLWLANAQECVIDGLASANLSSERVAIRLRSLRCFDALGKESHYRDVSGYGVDKDGRVGIKSAVAWSVAAKELLLTGAGAQERQSGLSRLVGTALGRATFGLSDSFSDNSPAAGPSPDAIRELRSMDTLLPTLTLEPGREFDVVFMGGTGFGSEGSRVSPLLAPPPGATGLPNPTSAVPGK